MERFPRVSIPFMKFFVVVTEYMEDKYTSVSLDFVLFTVYFSSAYFSVGGIYLSSFCFLSFRIQLIPSVRRCIGDVPEMFQRCAEDVPEFQNITACQVKFYYVKSFSDFKWSRFEIFAYCLFIGDFSILTIKITDSTYMDSVMLFMFR